jgi:hypothetical protein
MDFTRPELQDVVEKEKFSANFGDTFEDGALVAAKETGQPKLPCLLGILKRLRW